MKIDTTQILHDVWGKPLPESPARPEKRDEQGTVTEAAVAAVPWTLGNLCANAFLVPTKADQDKQGVDDRLKVYRYAKRFAEGGVIDLTVEELGEVRKRVAMVFMPALAGPALDLLDVPAPKAVEKDAA